MTLTKDTVCHICRMPIPEWAHGVMNHQLAPSRDHLVPKAQGGRGLPDNSAPAHRCCNSRRREVDHDVDETTPKLIEFAEKYPEFVIAHAYETSWTLLLSRAPIRLEMDGKWFGSGFNYGSTNLLEDCPKRLLILAEND